MRRLGDAGTRRRRMRLADVVAQCCGQTEENLGMAVGTGCVPLVDKPRERLWRIAV